jgi:hypothetical protein
VNSPGLPRFGNHLYNKPSIKSLAVLQINDSTVKYGSQLRGQLKYRQTTLKN